MAILTLDGYTFPDVGVKSLKRNFTILDGEAAGRVQAGSMIRDIIGSYINYTATLNTKNLRSTDYDALYELLSAPVESRRIILPYGQGTHTYDAYISSGDDELKLYKRLVDGQNFWDDLSITFTAMNPHRT